MELSLIDKYELSEAGVAHLFNPCVYDEHMSVPDEFLMFTPNNHCCDYDCGCSDWVQILAYLNQCLHYGEIEITEPQTEVLKRIIREAGFKPPKTGSECVTYLYRMYI